MRLLHLDKYITRLACGDEDRHDLVGHVLGTENASSEFVYVDDRQDNIDCIRRHYGKQMVAAVHVTDPLVMHAQVKTLEVWKAAVECFEKGAS
jgi:hypothetical protein